MAVGLPVCHREVGLAHSTSAVSLVVSTGLILLSSQSGVRAVCGASPRLPRWRSAVGPVSLAVLCETWPQAWAEGQAPRGQPCAGRPSCPRPVCRFEQWCAGSSVFVRRVAAGGPDRGEGSQVRLPRSPRPLPQRAAGPGRGPRGPDPGLVRSWVRRAPSTALPGGASCCVGGRGGLTSSGSVCLGPAAESSPCQWRPVCWRSDIPRPLTSITTVRLCPRVPWFPGTAPTLPPAAFAPVAPFSDGDGIHPPSPSSGGSKETRRVLVCSALSRHHGMTTSKLRVRKPSVTPAPATPERASRKAGRRRRVRGPGCSGAGSAATGNAEA